MGLLSRITVSTALVFGMAGTAIAQETAKPMPANQSSITDQLGAPLKPGSPMPSKLPDGYPIDSSGQSQEYQDASKEIMVMSKDEIKDFRSMLREYSKAASYRSDLVKRNTSISIDAHKPLSCVPGYVTIMNFVDAMGNPWAIDYIIVSNKNIVLAKKTDKYTIVLTAAKFAGEVNLIVKLKGIPLTKNFYINASDEVLDSSRIIRLHGQSPDYEATVIPVKTDIPAIKSDAFIMEQFLSNTPPKDAIKVTTDRERIDVWTLDDLMYIRTPFVLASPMAMEGQGTVTDGRGMYVYRLSSPVSRLNMLIKGKYFSVKVDI